MITYLTRVIHDYIPYQGNSDSIPYKGNSDSIPYKGNSDSIGRHIVFCHDYFIKYWWNNDIE